MEKEEKKNLDQLTAFGPVLVMDLIDKKAQSR